MTAALVTYIITWLVIVFYPLDAIGRYRIIFNDFVYTVVVMVLLVHDIRLMTEILF